MIVTQKLLLNYPYLIAMVLFSLGCFIVLSQTNLIKKVIGINIMQSAVFLFFIAMGDIQGRAVPIYDPAVPDALVINPLPAALILTGIVVSFSVTAFALSIIVRLNNYYSSIDAEEIMRLRS